MSYLNAEQIRQSLYNHINNYRVFQFPEQRKDDDWNDTEHDHHELLARSALATFQALFCDYTEFETSSAAKQYLLDTKNQPVGDVVSRFQVWIDLALERYRDSEGMYRVQARNARDLAKSLAPFTSGTPSDSSGVPITALWPLVEVVRYVSN